MARYTATPNDTSTFPRKNLVYFYFLTACCISCLNYGIECDTSLPPKYPGNVLVGISIYFECAVGKEHGWHCYMMGVLCEWRESVNKHTNNFRTNCSIVEYIENYAKHSIKSNANANGGNESFDFISVT